ncbi:ATP-binding protein [Alkalihalophilus marmarensis]|uniref:ATP-binding protein n=1 Tax=Alkalihalophilus marmarensis TaxID=521377 RepID=UPI00203D71A9|nr:ATP-binding protein [Alkalihalophilus marmarensis]MCM3488813.1 ATP-binding protein [Alkalihalophilus marmarensis]
MQAISQVMTDTTLTKNLPQISDKRCEGIQNGQVCNRFLFIIDGAETCPACDIFAAENKKLEDVSIQAWRRKETDKTMSVFNQESLVNERLKKATFESYEPLNPNLEKAKRSMIRYAENFSKDNPVPIILKGEYGLGKSHLAYATAKEIAKKGHTSIFISVPKLLTKIKGSYNDKSETTELELLEALERVDCLVLDDIGAEQTKLNREGEVSWSTSKLFEIIDARIGKHTIFTTNLDDGQMKKHLGPRNFSRLMEDVHPIKLTGEDYRLRRFKD